MSHEPRLGKGWIWVAVKALTARDPEAALPDEVLVDVPGGIEGLSVGPPVPDTLFVAGDSLSFERLVKEVEAGLGAPMTVKSLGSFSDLDAAIKTRYAAEPANVPAWLPLMYWRAMLNGSGQLGPLMNDRYPDIRPTGVREYVARLATERTSGGAQG